jgi:hypothetical protein
VNAPHKLYRYTNTGWTSVVPAVDITGTITSTQIADNAITTPKLLAQSITAAKIYAGTTQSNLIQANNIATGSITAAKIAVTSLSSLSVNAGDIQAGMIRSPDSGGAGNSAAKFDLTNGRIVFNSAPGIAGGYVRVTGGGFGPASAYLDWYGPKPAGQITDAAIIANLTDVAANYFLKTNGQFKAAAQRIRGEFEVKAWCNFDGLTNGNNAAQVIRDRYNVASVTRNGSQNGEFNITFAEPLANANYAVTVTGADSAAGGAPRLCTVTLLTVNGFRMFTWRHDASSLTKSSGEINTFIVFGSNVVGGSNVTAPSGGTGGGTIGWGNLPSNFVLP